MQFRNACVMAAAMAISPDVSALSYRDDVGYPGLLAELGASHPTGAGVAVSLVEASTVSSTPIWKPDILDAEFSGKTFTFADPLGAVSGHATGVAKLFFGNTTSMAPGITAITAYNANSWINAGFLGDSPATVPGISTSRVMNHSYVDNGNLTSSDPLRRIDWLVETDETIHVVAMNNGPANRAMFGSAYNVIAVGRTDGNHPRGSLGLPPLGASSTYSSNLRTRPDVVAPQSTTSDATPVVAAAAALLVETGHQDPSLSQGYTSNRAGNADNILEATERIYNAERAATVKAALMAGADRVTHNTASNANISDYRSAVHQTANGLDDRYGAGQVNILTSYQIIAGGEQNSIEDGGPGSSGSILPSGFDYDTSFGGSNSSNPVANYTFTADAAHNWLSASLVWNIDIAGPAANVFNTSATLHNLDLLLFDALNPAIAVATSASQLDNTENLWVSLLSGHTYTMRVTNAGELFEHGYALAWNIGPAPVPVPAAFWLLGSALTMLLTLRAPDRKSAEREYGVGRKSGARWPGHAVNISLKARHRRPACVGHGNATRARPGNDSLNLLNARKVRWQ